MIMCSIDDDAHNPIPQSWSSQDDHNCLSTYRNKDGRNGAGVVDICVWLASRDVRRAMFVERLASGVMRDGVG